MEAIRGLEIYCFIVTGLCLKVTSSLRPLTIQDSSSADGLEAAKLTTISAEYCLTEHFTPICQHPTDVIIMTSAVYGRMRVGRCVKGDYNIGCSVDVLARFDEKCSGRKACVVSIRSLVDEKPCERDFASYLEASFRCAPVLSKNHKQCSGKPQRRNGHVALKFGLDLPESNNNNNNNGGSVVVNSNDDNHVGDDDDDEDDDEDDDNNECYYAIQARPGQKLQLTLITLDAENYVAHLSKGSACTKVIVSDWLAMTTASGRMNFSQTGSEMEFSLCPWKYSRERIIYKSVGNRVEVKLEKGHDVRSGNLGSIVKNNVKGTFQLSSFFPGQSHQSNQSHLHQQHRHRSKTSRSMNDAKREGILLSQDTPRFMISYKILGCPLIDLSPIYWVKPITAENGDGSDIMVRCNETQETWYLTCRGSKWNGDVGNCTEGTKHEPSLGAAKPEPDRTENKRLTKHIVARGLLAALGLGLFIGVSIAILSLTAIFFIRKLCLSQERTWFRKLVVPENKKLETSASTHAEVSDNLTTHCSSLRCVSHLTPPPCLAYPQSISRPCGMHCGQPVGIEYLNSNPRLTTNEHECFELD